MAITRETVVGLLKRAVHAPSGDNTQPWRFIIHDDGILVQNVPERDDSLYSWGQRSSYVAHGALIETIAITARAAGFSADIEPFPNGTASDIVARIVLSPGPMSAHPLDAAIEGRATNRRPYRSTPLVPEAREALLASADDPVRLVLVEDPAIRANLGRAVALNEKVLFENERMHSFFFGHLHFTGAANERSGMSVATLELPPPVRALFPLLGKWKAMRILGALGFANGIVAANTATYRSGAATGVLILPDRSPASYLHCGRILQRAWLTATSHGLAFQTLSGIPFLMNRVAAGDPGLSPAHEKVVRNAYDSICDAVHLESGVVGLLFRTGLADAPSATTPRLEPDIS